MARPTTSGPVSAVPLLDSDAAATYLAVTERMVRRLTETRRLPFVKVGRHVRFRQSDLDAYITAQVVEASA